VRIDIAESIRELLADRLPVSLDGIGTLRLHHIPSQFGDKRQSLLPPSVDLKLSSDILHSGVLIDHLKLKYNIKTKVAEDYIKAFNQKVVGALSNFGKVSISGVGIINKSRTGEFSLEPDTRFINAFYQGYPEVKAEVKKANTGRLTRSSKILPPPPIPPPAGREINITPDEGVIEKAQKPIPVFDLPTDSEPKLSTAEAKPEVPTTKKSKNAFVEKLSEWDPPKKEYPKSDYDYKPSKLWPILSLLAFLILLLFLVKGCNALLFSGSSFEDHVNSEFNEIEKPFENADTSDALTNDLIADDSMNALADRPDHCIIITGTFASSRNIEAMKSKLTEHGYTIHTESFGAYTRVGLRFECAEVDLVEYIQDVRAKIDGKAWYLDPSFYVAYAN